MRHEKIDHAMTQRAHLLGLELEPGGVAWGFYRSSRRIVQASDVPVMPPDPLPSRGGTQRRARELSTGANSGMTPSAYFRGRFLTPESLMMNTEDSNNTIDTPMMTVPMALISGVIPRRIVDQMYIGSVLSRPVRK